MGPFTWLGLTATDPWRASAVHQLRPYFVHNAIENPDLAIDPLELLIIQPFILMPKCLEKNPTRANATCLMKRDRSCLLYVYCISFI